MQEAPNVKGDGIASENHYEEISGNQLYSKTDDYYRRKQFTPSSQDHYNRTSESGRHSVLNDHYNRVQFNASPQDHYNRSFRDKVLSDRDNRNNKTSKSKSHPVPDDHYNQSSRDAEHSDRNNLKHKTARNKPHAVPYDHYSRSARPEVHCHIDDYNNKSSKHEGRPGSDYHYSQTSSREFNVPPGDHYKRSNRGFSVPPEHPYSGRQFNMPPDGYYNRRQFHMPSDDYYDRRQFHMPSDDYYDRRQFHMPPEDHYNRDARPEMHSVPRSDYNEVLPKVQHSIQGDHYDRDSIDKGHRPPGDNYHGSSKIEGHCVPNDHQNRKQFNASREGDYNRGFRGGMGSIPDDECNRSSIDGRRSARVGKSSYEDHHNRRQSSMPPEDRYNKNSRGGMHSVPKDRYNENYENSHNSPTEDFDNETSTGGLNLIYTENYIPVTKKPSQQIALEICCPRAFENGGCDEINIVWHCRNCGEEVKYGFDNYFYCSCGKGLCQSYKFRCANKNHESYIQFGQTNVLKACLEQMRTTNINILVLGPTGVGKSTWLNSIINYMTFDTLEEAEESEPQIVIPVAFTVTDNDLNEQEVKYEVTDGDEDLKVGQSATQYPKTYAVPWNNTTVRIIDTPGIGDVRGIEKDKENVRNILDHISHLDELHAICILLKPNEARLSILFRFCVKELLTNLHKSASRNIIFCFTNARSTLYKPGDTLPVLSSLLKELAVQVTLSKDTIYCLDNESFRFLCTLRYPNITYDKFESESFVTSWVKSANETKRMFTFVKKLKPHKTADTITLNEARRLILTLTKPMADLTKNIELNISAIKDKQDEVARHKMSEEDLLKSLYIPAIVFQPKPLGYPRTVCTASNCVEYHQLRQVESKQIFYKQHCHEHCYLDVIPETFPNVILINCAAMGGTNFCQHCGCSWREHMHYTYEQEQVEVKVENESVTEEINSKKTLREMVEAKIKEMQQRVVTFEKEKKQIRRISAKFGCFLKEHAIVPYNDSMKAYLTHLIKEEENKIDPLKIDKKVLEALKNHLALYEEERKILESSMGSKYAKTISASDVPKLIKSLYDLPISGESLRKTMEIAQQMTRNIVEHNEKFVTVNKKKPVKVEVKKGKLATVFTNVKNYAKGNIF